MKLIFIITPNSGISYHRLVNPMSYIELKEGDEGEMLPDTDLTGMLDCDILMYNKYCNTPLEHIQQLQKKGMKVIVDVDDYWQLPTHHIHYQKWKDKGHSDKVAAHIRNADVVTCTTLLLQQKVRELNKNTVVIPNAFPYGCENYRPNPIPHGGTSFIYVGSTTHLEDVKLLEGKFRRINSDSYIKNNAEFIIAGYTKTVSKRFFTIWDQREDNQNYVQVKINGNYDRIVNIFANTGCHRVLDAVDPINYIDFYDQADVSIIPLVDSEWNSLKSPLKLAEAGCKQIPVICSRVQPYSEYSHYKGIMWVDTPDDWIKHIKWCIKNPGGVAEKGLQMVEDTHRDFDLEKWNKVREQLIYSLVK